MHDLMSSVKNSYPKFTIIQPSTGKPIYYRPFTVREEKSLILGKELGKYSDFLLTITEIVDNCFSSDTVKINSKKLPIFDVEYMFLRIREKSISEIIKITFVCPATKQNIKSQINIMDIQVVKQENSPNIQISDKLIVNMKYPSFEYLIENATSNEDGNIDVFDMVLSSIESIQTPDGIFTDLSKQSLNEFVENLTKQQYQAILDFFVKSPKIEHVVKYNTDDGVEREITFKGIRDFFQ